jgi:hypothetical protein
MAETPPGASVLMISLASLGPWLPRREQVVDAARDLAVDVPVGTPDALPAHPPGGVVEQEQVVHLLDERHERAGGVQVVDTALLPVGEDAQPVHRLLVHPAQLPGDDGGAAAARAAAEAGDHDERLHLADGEVRDRRQHVLDVLRGDARAQFVVRADAVALHAGLPDEDARPQGDRVECDEVRLRRVDRDRVDDDIVPRPV